MSHIHTSGRPRLRHQYTGQCGSLVSEHQCGGQGSWLRGSGQEHEDTASEGREGQVYHTAQGWVGSGKGPAAPWVS